MKLAIQIILYKSAPNVPALLESLKAQTFRDFEVFFYDNSELVDEIAKSRRLIEASGLPAHFVAGEKNIGFSGANPVLFSMHEAPFIMLLNDDVKLDPGYLEALMRRIESDPDIGSVSGLIYLLRDGERRVDSLGMEYVALGKIVERHAGRLASELADELHSPQEVFGATAALAIYRREAIEKAGGLFDPAWFMYKEDADLALRLRKAGYQAWYEPKAVAWHKRGLPQEMSLLKRFMREWKRPAILRQSAYANQWRIYKRHFRWSLGWKDILQTVWIELFRSGGTLLASPRVFIKAWYDILRT